MLHHLPPGWLRQIYAGQVFQLAEWEVYNCMALGLLALPVWTGGVKCQCCSCFVYDSAGHHDMKCVWHTK
eukprot:668490-Rhodomonas_salina.1